MYLWTAGAFGLVGMAFSLVMRTELAETGTIISAETYNSIFTMHGSVMIFLFLLPIGAAVHELFDAAANRRVGYGLPADQRALVLDLPLRRRADHIELRRRRAVPRRPAGPPTRPSRSTQATTLSRPAPGMDMWLIGVILLGQASIFGSVNFLVTIFKMRAPGMTMWRLPLFTWTTLVTGLLILLSTPVLAAALVLGFIDRNGAGGAFFDPAAGGQPLLWQNLFWFYSHPAVYIMIMPRDGHRL